MDSHDPILDGTDPVQAGSDGTGAATESGAGVRAADSPRSAQRKRARYLFTVEIAGYPFRVFTNKRLGGFVGTSPASIDRPHEIHLLEGLAPVPAADTLLHEILHCVSTVTMLGDDEQPQRLTEAQVSILATTLTDTMRRNPALREYLRTQWES